MSASAPLVSTLVSTGVPTRVSTGVAVAAAGAAAALALPVARPPLGVAVAPPRGAQRGGLPLLRLISTVSVALGVLFLVGGPVGAGLASAAAAVCWWLT